MYDLRQYYYLKNFLSYLSHLKLNGLKYFISYIMCYSSRILTNLLFYCISTLPTVQPCHLLSLSISYSLIPTIFQWLFTLLYRTENSYSDCLFETSTLALNFLSHSITNRRSCYTFTH